MADIIFLPMEAHMNLPKKKLYILLAIIAIALGIAVSLLGAMSLTSHLDQANGKEAGAQVIEDIMPPALALAGDTHCIINWGEAFVEPGFFAYDNTDGNITDSVTIEGSINSKTFGEQTLTYTVTDSSGNTGQITRIVSVAEFPRQTEEQTANPPGKVVYLTFDDGPTQYTHILLDILDKYNVKATFFVTNQFSAYQDMIGETYRRGHTIALHTYSHRFDKIYTSEAAYYDDLSKIHAICEAQTGVTPKIVRFPGGTSNSISKKHCRGIMSAITRSIGSHGYLYTDWNVDSDDAGDTKTREGVFANVIAGLEKRQTPIVLQHDTYLYSVEAVEDIIVWGLANGYTFLPMTEESPMIHHPVNN